MRQEYNQKVNFHKAYYKEMLVIGLPVTLQSIFQASYSLVDQLMVGSLGTVSIAGSGLGAKFSSLVTVTISAIAAVASILIAQYHGNKDKAGVNQSFFSCFYIAMAVMLLFAIPSIFIPDHIMSLYTTDSKTIQMAAGYLRIIAISFLPMTITLLLSSMLRSMEMSRAPMYASILSMGTNILFNYIFIFGKFGMPRLSLIGAGIGTLIARSIEAFILICMIFSKKFRNELTLHPVAFHKSFYRKISGMVIPILLNEFLWSFGENIYAAIYGRLGTQSLAAVTLTNPIQAMFIGMFTGVSSAAAVMVGKRLGQDEKEAAYDISKYLVKVGLVGSVMIGCILVFLATPYVALFSIEPEVARLTRYLIYVLAIVLFAKITNMILAGGIIRSGGNTHYTLIIDLIGTWVFGVPLALIAAYVWKLPVYLVYFILSQEEVVRLILGFLVFRKKKWMKNITKE